MRWTEKNLRRDHTDLISVEIDGNAGSDWLVYELFTLHNPSVDYW
jgi:hypothetical protein